MNILIEERSNYSNYCSYVFRRIVKMTEKTYMVRCKFDNLNQNGSMSKFSFDIESIFTRMYE